MSDFEWRKSSYSNGSGGDCVEIGAARWRKSSHSNGDGGNCVEAAGHWRKSSHSNGDGGECVEVGTAGGVVPVRDTKDRGAGPILVFPADAWARFIARL
ncbi:DUF397 domain-containing protein [Streptomyces sp. NPDC048172]|uniref:DUF397 domain-containing protein n=1 Tax=Streptomyces sp. NPDC048172 TaxID=3365505 RepID=UPI00371ECBCE